MTEQDSRSQSAQSQGGGYHGGPKRWGGRGPPPARHIPWPEIFKHHISLIEGHLKMVDMVRKHTVEGTGNWRMICGLVDRSKEMLRVSKELSWSFTPPANQREQVPLGVSSESMYPGYSPADHQYGKAAEEYGKAVAEAKKRGVDIPKHPDFDYQTGQGKGIKRKTLAQMRELRGEGTGSGSGSGEGSASEGPSKKHKTNGHAVSGEPAPAVKDDAPSGGDNPCFVIDTKPTPVNFDGHELVDSSSKRATETQDEVTAGKKAKKSKRKHSGDLPGVRAETEDITEEVDTRLKEKEEKRKRKEEKKRKRESKEADPKTEAIAVEETSKPTVEEPTVESEIPKKKKKKVKHGVEVQEAEPASEKTEKDVIDAAENDDGKQKKKRKKNKDA